MSITVLEVLKNAEYNLINGSIPIQRSLAIQQLSNAILQLEEDSDADNEFIEKER